MRSQQVRYIPSLYTLLHLSDDEAIDQIAMEEIEEAWACEFIGELS